jgi:hypothetical protein
MEATNIDNETAQGLPQGESKAESSTRTSPLHPRSEEEIADADSSRQESSQKAPETSSTRLTRMTLEEIIQHPSTGKYGIPVAAIFLYIVLCNPSTLGTWLVGFLSRVLGWTVGVSLGLGGAMHVYEQLDAMSTRQIEKEDEDSPPLPAQTPAGRTARSLSSGSTRPANSSGRSVLFSSPSSNIPGLEDEYTYASLMQSAGYYVENIMRGQVCKTSDPIWQSPNYPFTEAGDAPHALHVMSSLFPSLPDPVRLQLSKFIEHILRDYVSSWYSMMDATVKYQPERDKRAAASAPGSIETDSSSVTPSTTGHVRRMVYCMKPHRKAPFMEKIYEAVTIAFGNLATRVEDVNVMELALLKWTKVLAYTFRTYRHLRRLRLSKQPDEPLSEMALTKEFLLAGKLHKAITFGLDVPSLLFADATGQECSIEGVLGSSSIIGNDLAVLEARLYATGLLAECELDYNRVFAFRMVRALLPRADFGSPLVASLVTEIMAGCVLTPLMSVFCPENLNAWIIAGLGRACNSGSNAKDSVPSSAMSDEGPNFEQGVENVGIGEINGLFSDAIPPLNSVESPHSSRLYTQTAPPETQESVGSLESNERISGSGAIAMNADLVSQLAQVLIDLQEYMDLPEMKQAKDENREGPAVEWDDEGCRAVILRLVLVIEAALMDGRCTYKTRNDSRMASDSGGENDDLDDSDRPVEVTLTQYESTTLTQLLMELTGDINAFEERVTSENTLEAESQHLASSQQRICYSHDEPYISTAAEQSTLRTLIAAWLHTGNIYRTMMVLVQAHATILIPYYHDTAFLRTRLYAKEFLKLLRPLDGIDFLVDTMSILNSPRLEEVLPRTESGDSRLLDLPPDSRDHERAESDCAQSVDSFILRNSIFLGSTIMSNSSTPRHVDFHRNESFAASLRSERERRMQSWNSLFEGPAEEGVRIICHSVGASDEDVSIHRELHQLARIFYSGTNLISIRDAARRSLTDDRSAASPNSSSAALPVSLLTVEMASPRRRIEVPDDDSSFLLRAQPRPLNAVGVHRDQRNHDQSFKCFAGTFEEPALSTEHFSGGRFLRYCYIKYYPIDRTASISEYNEKRRVDQRKTKTNIPGTITLANTATSRQTPFLSGEFLRERHLCQRWIPRGSNRTQSILASSVMEPTDFTSQPRTGKAMDFVYRMTFFEKPMIELGGKIFTVHDSTSLGTHRADASALEMSDAAMSAALLSIGETVQDKELRSIQMGEDGYPILWMKFSRKQDDAEIEVRPYRVSLVRAALLVTAARHEAQLQSLVSCVRAGSVKRASKALTDARLKPVMRLLDYASSRSREKQSLLLRDIKLGVNHIDRDQLRRNGLWSPRYPTSIQELFVTVEDCVSAEDVGLSDGSGFSSVLYQIRVAAIVEVVCDDNELDDCVGYRDENGQIARTLREEWIVYRAYKEFQMLHKHLKNQVSTSESSGTAVSRLSASLNSANTSGRRHRSALIPSLSQASKIGALGLTKKSLQKRREYLDGYLAYLFAPDHLLNRCMELLLFIGALFPLPQEVRPGRELSNVPDPFGRTKMTRSIIRGSEEAQNTTSPVIAPPPTARSSRMMSQGSVNSFESGEDVANEIKSPRKSKRKIKMIPSIRNKIDKVPLSQVRNRIFELLRYQFGFENASFVRNRMLAAIKTASFAVTSASEFRRMLYTLHTEHLSGPAVANLIKFGLDLLWPDGVFFVSSPPLSVDEVQEQSEKSQKILHESFPDAVRTVLGSDLTTDGLNVLHEMLQNRAVVKSLFYMLFDLLWVEVFPEIADVLQGGAVLGTNM